MRPPKPGELVCYRYLWTKRDFGRSPRHSDKLRPALVMVREPIGPGLYHIMMLAISTKKQREPDKALAVPQDERLKAGLKERSWIVTSGMNSGTWPSEMFYPFRAPDPSHGLHAKFSAEFFAKIAATVSSNIKAVEAEKLRKQKRNIHK